MLLYNRRDLLPGTCCCWVLDSGDRCASRQGRVDGSSLGVAVWARGCTVWHAGGGRRARAIILWVPGQTTVPGQRRRLGACAHHARPRLPCAIRSVPAGSPTRFENGVTSLFGLLDYWNSPERAWLKLTCKQPTSLAPLGPYLVVMVKKFGDFFCTFDH